MAHKKRKHVLEAFCPNVPRKNIVPPSPAWKIINPFFQKGLKYFPRRPGFYPPRKNKRDVLEAFCPNVPEKSIVPPSPAWKNINPFFKKGQRYFPRRPGFYPAQKKIKETFWRPFVQTCLGNFNLSIMSDKVRILTLSDELLTLSDWTF